MRIRAALILVTVGAGCSGQIAPPDCPDCPAERHSASESCAAVAPPPLLLAAQAAFPHLPPMTEPVTMARPAGRGPWYLVERHGRVRRFDDRPDADTFTDVLDLTAEVDWGGDGGLVAAAFHPHFAENGRLFLSYGAVGGAVTRSRLARFTSPDGGASFGDRQILIDIDQTAPDRIHLNADLKFGPDGLLYAGFGDGGPQGDPDGNGQNLDELRGKILRLDVDQGEPYTIPADNPFAEGGGRPELYAWGLRNPWRFSFDAGTGELWAGDVGYVSWEEVDRVHRGDNLGWPVHEGSGCFLTTSCESAGYAAPVIEYKHEGDAGAAVVGGVVYRGRALPALVGRYLFGDYVSGDVWALDGNGGRELVAHTGRRIDSFVEDGDGELYLVDFGGSIVRLVPSPPASNDVVAERLSRTGCFREGDLRQPTSRLIGYDVRVPFWSDGAAKRRFLALPPGTPATFASDGHLLLPVGAVLAKQFLLGDRPVETRLFMKYGPAQWAGYSYVWNTEGTEAFLAPADETTRLWGDSTWTYPSRAACSGCHNSDRGLGLEVAQLDLEPLRRAGLVTGDPPAIPPLPRLDGEASVAERVRAYLQVNCAICHTRDGPTPVDMDLRFATDLALTRTCGVFPSEGDLGVAGAARLSPGAPERSLISVRMHALGTNHMPPLGPHTVDATGAALVDEWIRELARCPASE
jgi:uncharacterized repeat protein (TIGR03806 family)